MRALVVYCHPVPESFCAALRDTAVTALEAKGWQVRLIDLYAQGFDPVMPSDERRNYNNGAPTDPVLRKHADDLAWAEALVFVYPTWWYGLPAMLKGWLDRTWATNVAFSLPSGEGSIVSRLQHIRRLGVVTTCGASWWVSLLMGQPGRKTILRGIRALCARRCRTFYLAHYDMDSSTPESREAYLRKVAERLQHF